MKNVFILLFLVFCSITSAQIINFPDSNFKKALVNTKCVDINGDNIGDSDADLNNDGEIDVSEALKVQNLLINNLSITSLLGIEHFNTLKSLSCSNNQIENLNVEELINLKYLFCNNNEISKLTIQNLKDLEILDCSKNKLISFNLSGLVNLKDLNCESNQITQLSLIGLNNLVIINCSANKLTSLNVLNLNKLEKLVCYQNQLTALYIDGLKNLKQLYAFSNRLTSLNLNQLSSLDYLSCYLNQITSLNLDDLVNLRFLFVDNNQLTELNFKNLKKLSLITCSNNRITHLNLSGLINLNHLDCNGNGIMSLNLNGLYKLHSLHCANNKIETLNLKTGRIFDNLDFFNNLELSYICCDDYNILRIRDLAIKNGQIYCEVNSYCSFTPGGKFFKLKGVNKYDSNSNGCDAQDDNIPNLKFNITSGIVSGTYISNTTGQFSIPLQAGTYTITPTLEGQEGFTITPPSSTITFPSTSDTITQNFCIIPKGIFRQTNITVIPLSPPARPGFDASYKIVWENVGNQIESGAFNFIYDETLLDYISATQTADQIADGIVSWNFSNLLPFEKREITITLKVNSPTDTPEVNAGDKLYLTASILDNIFTLENTVVGSYDPNDKTCLQGDRVKPDMVGEYVDYLIRFENTGNYAAENVVVKDIIDTKRFDISTLKITDASHEVYTRIEGNKVEFIFEKIQLPFDDANNDGYIAFKIKTLPTLVLGDSLKNMADIYFDYNFPIRTNEAQTTVAFPVFTKDLTTEVNIYPNPVTEILYLDTNDHWTKAEIFDIAGRIMRSISLDTSSMDVSGLESGTYFIRLKDGEKVGLVKFMKI